MNKRPKLHVLLAQLEAAAILHEATGKDLERLRMEIQALTEEQIDDWRAGHEPERTP